MVDHVRRDIEEENKARCHSQISAKRAEGHVREEFLAPWQSEVDRIGQRHRSTGAFMPSENQVYMFPFDGDNPDSVGTPKCRNPFGAPRRRRAGRTLGQIGPAAARRCRPKVRGIHA
jgi:hypothetical protein